jgi:putative hemolysin
MPDPMVLTILLLLGLLLLNGVFAMAELAMMTSRQSRLQHAARSGSKGSAVALTMAREPTRFLSTVQVGITLIGIMAGALGEGRLSGPIETLLAAWFPWAAPYAATAAFVIVVVGITYVSLVLGELVPKRLALAHPEAIASAIARPLQVLSVVTAVPVRLLTVSTEGLLAVLRIKPKPDDVSEEDVRSLVSRAASTGVFTPQEHTLFQRVFRVGDLRVRDLMVPRPDIVWIDKSTTVDMMQVLIGTNPFSHFPVCDGDLDRLVGVVHIKDVIAYGLISGREFDVSKVAQKPLFVPETMPALRLLDQFQASRTHIAFVVDEYGGTQGLITLNDVLGALVGDLSRRGEEPPPKAVRRADGSWLMEGALPLHEMVVTLGLSPAVEAELPDVSTVGGLVLASLGHIPATGERVQWQGYMLEVVDMDGTRIDQVLVSPARPGAEDGPHAGA